MFHFWDFVIKYVKFKCEKVEETVLQQFWKENRAFIKQKWNERVSKNEQFAMLIVNYFINANALFPGFYW